MNWYFENTIIKNKNSTTNQITSTKNKISTTNQIT